MSNADYLLKKYGAGKKGDNPSAAVKKKVKKSRRDEGNQVGGMRIVDQDDQDWMRAGDQDQGDQNESEIYKLMRKEYQRTQQGIEQEETEELGEEAPQVVDTQFKSRENSGWETIDLNASKQKKSATSNMEVDGDSPPRRTRHDSPEASPPRRTRHDSPDASPPRRTRHDSPSPPRRTRHDSPDASPPRRTRHDSPSPPRRPAAAGDASPPRRPKAASSNGDASPPRRQASRSPSPPRRTLGANAETVYRDKSGKKIDVKLEKLKADMEKNTKQEEAEKHMVWGKGLVQQRQQEDRLKNLKEIAAMPFATYKGDLAKDESMKNIERWGDPMAGLVPKKEAKETRPKYRGPAPPPNRFDIAPGFRWDGVDRSNGYERKSFMRENAREANKEEAYQYSVSDM